MTTWVAVTVNAPLTLGDADTPGQQGRGEFKKEVSACLVLSVKKGETAGAATIL